MKTEYPIEYARRFAFMAHGGQMYGIVPYSVHLEETYQVAKRFNLSEDIKAACFLHDILEDTNTAYWHLEQRFGKEIAELVYAVTNELGRDKIEVKRKSYMKIAEHGIDAVLLKLCDRIANIENAIEHTHPIWKSYVAEHEMFAAYLNIFSDKYPIWAHYLDLIENCEEKVFARFEEYQKSLPSES